MAGKGRGGREIVPQRALRNLRMVTSVCDVSGGSRKFEKGRNTMYQQHVVIHYKCTQYALYTRKGDLVRPIRGGRPPFESATVWRVSHWEDLGSR